MHRQVLRLLERRLGRLRANLDRLTRLDRRLLPRQGRRRAPIGVRPGCLRARDACVEPPFPEQPPAGTHDEDAADESEGEDT